MVFSFALIFFLIFIYEFIKLNNQIDLRVGVTNSAVKNKEYAELNFWFTRSLWQFSQHKI